MRFLILLQNPKCKWSHVDAPIVVRDRDRDSKDGSPGSKQPSTGMALNHHSKEKPHCKKWLKSHPGSLDSHGESDEELQMRESSPAISDGECVLQNVQVNEQRNKCGPENHTLNYWNDPKAIIDHKSKLQWLFKCQYCDQWAELSLTYHNWLTLLPGSGLLLAHWKGEITQVAPGMHPSSWMRPKNHNWVT